MKKVMTATFALSALFAASGKVHADVNYPWCLMGDTRGYECVFSSREQCAQDGRNRGFGGQCVQNPVYKPGKPTASDTSRPSRAASTATVFYWAGRCYNDWRECAKAQGPWPSATSGELTGCFPRHVPPVTAERR